MTELVEKGASILKKMGVEKYDIYAVEGEGFTVEVKGGAPEKVKSSQQKGIAVRIIIDGRLGFAYTNETTEEGLRVAIECAKENAINSEPDDYPLSPPQETEFDLPLVDENFFKIPVEKKVEIAVELEERAREYDKRVEKVRKASYGDRITTVYYLNSNGNTFSYSTTSYWLSILLAAKEGESSQMGWDYQGKRFFSELNPVEVAANAAKGAVELLGAKPLKTMKVPVIFKNAVFAELIEALSSAFLGTSVLRKKSLFADKLSREVASQAFTLYDDPFQKDGFGSSPYDDEGTPTRKTAIIEKGTLKNFLVDLYSSKKLQLNPTGNGIRPSISAPPTSGITNLVVERGVLGLEELIKTPKEVILITEAMGIHTVNPISGEFSIGISGIYFYEGEKVSPVSGMTVAGNVLELLNGITEVGSDQKWLGNVCSPSVLVKELTVSGD
ncbi:TldD/PmbA family protein [Thermovibrio sp.]